MGIQVRRIFVEKKPGFNVEAEALCRDFQQNLGILGLQSVRVVNRYDIQGINEEIYQQSRNTIFSEPPVDIVYDEQLHVQDPIRMFAVEFLPGQYDQRADSAAQCIQILTQSDRPIVTTAKVVLLSGDISDEEFNRIKQYYINPVESREATLDKPLTIELQTEQPSDVQVLDGFCHMDEQQMKEFMQRIGFAMNFEDLLFCQKYFRDTEKRDPTITELKVIDTYWSDHCRHTTFLTEIQEVTFDENENVVPMKAAYQRYLKAREIVYGEENRDVCLMDLAVIGMKELRKQGKLQDLDVSDEVNACSIVVDVDVEGEIQEWLVMFKNETHNHPTEIEPYGGAATCLGGAIRDPLSGRSYVYQAMRVTGSGDPRARIEDTIPGKLPQRKITTEAAAGYSGYGNQIGLATGHVAEVYDEGFVAKRMEIGAVMAAAPKENVVRIQPSKGDVVILAGGRTGRDGCGGATGSSKEHDEDSIFTCGAEVQKGNPPTERKLQRLFRNPKVSMMIKKCNDFGAGGVSVAIGELTDSLKVNLDVIPKKYEGLDGTELAISESQERMAVVVAAEDAERFIRFAQEENVEATVVAEVTDNRRLQMYWRGNAIVDLSRDFLDTNGVKQTTKVHVNGPQTDMDFLTQPSQHIRDELKSYPLESCETLRQAWIANLTDLNVAGQQGLVERFDSTIGAGTVLMPFGGKYQATPAEGMVAKIPVIGKETNTATIMTHGYNPKLASWSPFHGALYAVVEAVAKVVAIGGRYDSIRLTLQEYFEKLGTDASKWGKPFSALLGAYHAQEQFGIPAIGGKDSMSGTFKDLHVPPTLVAFAVDVVKADKVISPEFKQAGSQVVFIPSKFDGQSMIDFDNLKANFTKVTELIHSGKVLAAHTVKYGGIAEALTKMAFGNKIGFRFEPSKANAMTQSMEIGYGEEWFLPKYGSLVLELPSDINVQEALGDIDYIALGNTTSSQAIQVGDMTIMLDELYRLWQEPLQDIFPIQAKSVTEESTYNFEKTEASFVKTGSDAITYNSIINADTTIKSQSRSSRTTALAQPRVLIPVFPGTNCEYDTHKAFEKAGGQVDTMIIRNLTSVDIENSIATIVDKIKQTQILMLPGGFSGGDEPDGSGKFYATLFRNPRIKEAVMDLLQNRDGLVLGICNGFQALIKLGLLPYGEIRDMNENSPTLTFNTIGRHISTMVQTKVVSNQSPWLRNVEIGEIHSIPVSHGEGRFFATVEELQKLIDGKQVATQYVNQMGNPTMQSPANPNGSIYAIEGITSPDGRIFGKMGHSERIGNHVAINVPGKKDQRIFEAGISYFK
ncbi:phosphoribosylformylglycinamidine synthase [Desulfuribacillus stibiiarsenatis]|uniref:Phosphoribosylformylglycinamidine synthase n=1 Tax=Desulfuribacillus stibiiarsenatis TaxID=1390249 RepID=A0A1E5L6A9_9FIRM|nr:phosphoribosylformylglycinamidine synthase [Desulfuribacillus stibiiarsenatis]